MDALAQLKTSLTGRYDLEREIGRGGMATVYLARDVRHNRRVALKVLDPELGAVLGVERFLSEIQVTANLQHPNLLPLFDSGEAEGLLFYVMPYVDGESLRAKLEREKQLPLGEAIHVASAVASALDYAHRHGVIHRDLKPENILLHEGQPLVADFGIALAVSNAGGHRITQTGISLGTPQYMSPEQATGDRSVDGRTDVYSLGAVVYEMLTGEPPHSGTTAQAIIAKVITDRPRSIRLSRDTVPSHVEVAVERALAKLPADRFHNAREFGDALQGRDTGGVALPSGIRTPGTLEPYGATPKWRDVLNRPVAVLLAAALIVGGVVAGLTVWRLAARRAELPATSFIIEPPAPEGVRQDIGAVAISRDGSTVAFVVQSDSSSQVHVRRLGDLESRPLPGTSGAFELAFSPDGKWLAVITSQGSFVAQGRLFKVLMDGSSALTITDRAWAWAGMTWENDRTLLFNSAFAPGSGIARIPASGGTARPLTKPSFQHGHPLVAPDGKILLFSDWGPGSVEDDFLAIGSVASGEFSTTSLLASQPIGVVDDKIVYLNTVGAIMAVPFDARSRRITGEPARIIEDVTISGPRPAALSPSGTLVYKRGQVTQLLVLVDSSGAARELSSEARFGGRPTFSPDGRRIAASIRTLRGDTVTSDIWIFEMSTGVFTRLTSMGNVINQQWTPDGKYLVFTPWRSDSGAIWRQVADGSQPPEKLLALPDVAWVGASVTPDGRGVLYCHRPNAADFFYLPFASKPEPVKVAPLHDYDCGAGHGLSRDGRWLAYVASDGGKANVYVRSFRGTGGRVQVSADGGDSPLWSRDGRRLYYRRSGQDSESGTLFVAHVKVSNDGLDVIRRERLVALREGGVYDVAPDGKHVLMLQRSNARVQLVVTTNWPSQLRARLAGTK